MCVSFCIGGRKMMERCCTLFLKRLMVFVCFFFFLMNDEKVNCFSFMTHPTIVNNGRVNVHLLSMSIKSLDGDVVISEATATTKPKIISSRRQAFEKAASSIMIGLPTVFMMTTTIVTTTASTSVEPANAFANKISTKYDDRPKRRGPQPKDLGVLTRTTVDGYDEYVGLKPCGASPNCFCSTMTQEDDEDHSIPGWNWPINKFENSFEKAMEELHQIIVEYEPGQNGVDGGGFEIKVYEPKKGYLYVQFEALKGGYIDDFEAAYIPDTTINNSGKNTIHIRSSSRVGYLDFGVNAKRINYIAEKLRNKGWDAIGVDYQVHKGYALENQI